MPRSSAGVDHVRQVGGIQTATVGAGRRTWAKVDPAHISESWAEQSQALGQVVLAAQQRAATEGSGYAAAVLAEQGTWVAPQAFVDPSALAGWAPDGRTLEGLLNSPAITAKNLIGKGFSTQDALLAAGQGLDVILSSLMADTSRQAASIDIAARDGVGWVRMVNPPCCDRCAILAGRFYRWNDGFLRHPRCLPAGTVVSGPQVEAATRRWYEGELVVIRTAAGQELSITGNHPVLTDQGWVPAHLVQEGDHVVRSTRLEGATPLVVPDEQQAPALVEYVRRADGMVPLGHVPTSAEDFHGDGLDGQVDVVLADRLLRHRGDTAATEFFQQPLFSGRSGHASGFDREGSSEQLLWGLMGSSHCSVCGTGLQGTLLGGHLGGSDESGFGSVAYRHAGFLQAPADDVSGDAVSLAERVLALPGLVGIRDVVDGERDLSPRWDPATPTFSADDLQAYSGPGLDLLARLAGQVELDRVVEVERISWSGHVYNLSTVEGWYSADGLIVSNCDCIHRPATAGSLAAARSEGLIQDPYEYFRSLSAAEQDRIFTRAGAQAIRDGADMGRVVNSRRGMTANGMFTSEGMGKRGFARQQLRPGQRRLTPEGLAQMYPDRAEYLAALREHGYLIPGGQDPLGSLKGAWYEGYGGLGRGGTRKAATAEVLRAQAAGVRSGSRYTMTAAERRLYDAQTQWAAVLEGRNPWGKGPLTPQIAAAVEKNYRNQLTSAGQVFTGAEDAVTQAQSITVRAAAAGGGSGTGGVPGAPAAAGDPFDESALTPFADRSRWGRVDVPERMWPRPEPHELDTAARLAAYGYDVEFRLVSTTAGVKNPDIVLDGEAWEMKSPLGSSPNTVAHQISRARKQGRRLVLDTNRTSIDDASILAEIRRRFSGDPGLDEVIVVLKDGTAVRITRHL